MRTRGAKAARFGLLVNTSRKIIGKRHIGDYITPMIEQFIKRLYCFAHGRFVVTRLHINFGTARASLLLLTPNQTDIFGRSMPTLTHCRHYFTFNRAP